MNVTLKVLLFLLWAAPLVAGGPPARSDISLANVRWQPLPGTIEKVFVGPDGRTWYRYNTSHQRPSNVRHITTVASIKQQIAQEFQKAAPQLKDIEPALFEPGGRVWFSLCSVGHLLLLGYDGKEWTEYTILDPDGSITGRCPTRGALLEGRTNRFAGGTAWFITQCGVLSFDGKRWQHQKLIDKPKLSRYGYVYRSDGIWLAVSPDGQAAVAYACETKEFSIFKQGKWSPCKAADPKDSMWDVAPPPRGLSNTRKEKMRGLVLPDNQTAWYLVSSGLLRQLPLSTDDEAASPTSVSSDVLKDDNHVAFEDLGRLSECRQVYEDGNGRVFVIAAKIDGQEDGVAIVQRDRKVAMLLGTTLASAWKMSYREDIPPILTQSGDQVWLVNRHTADPPKLLDLKKGEFVDSLPNPEFSRLHAVSGDGRVFVSVALPRGTRPIAVYTPGAPHSDSPLKVSHIAAASHRYAITDKGMIWVNAPDGLTRFDGYQWRAVGGTKDDRAQFLLPGHNDTMLVWNKRTATFYQGQQEVASGERFDLFQQHRDRMKKAFGPGPSSGQALGAGASHFGVLFDRTGNIWCLEPSGRLLVENQGTWRDTNEALTSAGSRAGHVVSMALIGDGSRLYIGDKNVQTIGGHAFFGELKNGKPSFVPAPQEQAFSDQPHHVTDRDGMLWIYNSSKRGQTTYRINGQGVPENLGDVGAPVLADEAGNVWLCDIQGPIQDTYNVWRDGKIVQKLQIPHADRNTFLFSNQPGSVYAWTISGLQHLVADGPKFDKYRLERLYPLEGISGQSLSRGYSKHGYLVTLTALDTRTAPYYYLYLVKLPESNQLYDSVPPPAPANSGPTDASKNVVCNPPSSLTISGFTLYGMSGYGGAQNRGAVFSFPVEGGDPTILVSFDGSNGAQPWGNLAFKGTTLYGMTSAGGAHDKGTVFSLSIHDGTFTTLASFDGTNGAKPSGSLTLSADGTVLYGMTERGGSKDLGTVFSIPIQGGSPTVLASFDGSNGAQPLGSLTINGSTLYGATSKGGANGQGAIFSVPTGGGTVTVLASFNGSNGNNPLDSLTLCGSTLYGMTWLGGVRGKGTVFSVPVDGGAITAIASFGGRNGEWATGSLMLSNSTLYGMTDQGGANNKGTVFSIPVAGGTLKTLISFSVRDRAYLRRTLALAADGSTLYGMTTRDGAGVPGTVFSLPTHAKHAKERDIAEFIKPVLPNQQTDVEHLNRVIKETIKPKSAERQPSNADVEALLHWSKPVNGLIARIEYVWAKSMFFVRLKNVSDRPLAVPTANSSSEGGDCLFDVYTQQGSSPWQRITHTGRYDRYFPAPWKTESHTKASQGSRGREPDALGRQPIDRPAVTLEPGEDCIAMVTGSEEEGTGEPKTVKVVLRQPDTNTAGRWSGILETPSRPMRLSPNQSLGLRGTVPFPVHFPPLSHDYSEFMNRSPFASLVEQLHGPNRPLISILTIYEPAGVRTELEQRMQAERKMPMKLLLASAAAVAGSEEAAMLFLNTMKDTDYRAVVNLHYALWATYRNCASRLPDGKREQPPTWLEELFLAILSDHRAVTGMGQTNFREGTSFTVSSCATEKLVFALEGSRCRKAVPLLVERVKRREADWYTLHALGEIGDPRAVSALIQGVKGAYFDERLYEQAVHALGKLKARDAVPALLQDIEYVVSINALAEIGDSSAVPALRQLVTTKGQIIRNEKPVSPERDSERFYAAKVALRYFDAKDGVVQLAKMLDDPTLTRSQRYDVVLRLGKWSDPRTIPYLVRVIKTESDFYIVILAIGGLVELKNPAAVEGLIDCLDVTFKPQDLGKGERATPATCRNRITQGLQRITGQSLGADKQLWLRWWTEEGSKTLK